MYHMPIESLVVCNRTFLKKVNQINVHKVFTKKPEKNFQAFCMEFLPIFENGAEDLYDLLRGEKQWRVWYWKKCQENSISCFEKSRCYLWKWLSGILRNLIIFDGCSMGDRPLIYDECGEYEMKMLSNRNSLQSEWSHCALKDFFFSN